MTTMQDLANAVAAEATVEASVLSLLNGMVAQIKAAQVSTDTSAMDKVVADIQAHTSIMQAAVVANTPATPVAVAP